MSVINFKDPRLEQLIRKKIKKRQGPINVSDIEHIEMLDLSAKRITSIEGLEHFMNLNYLDLEFNWITDISPLRELFNLTYVELSENRISDISPLRKLDKLEQVRIAYNNVSDLKPLAGLEKIVVCIMSSNQIKDINPLKKMTQLEVLMIDHNEIEDLSVIKNFKHLKKLFMYENPILDIDHLDLPSDLEVYDGRHTHVEDDVNVKRELSEKEELPYRVLIDEKSITRLIDIEDESMAQDLYDKIFDFLSERFEDDHIISYIEATRPFVDFDVYEKDELGKWIFSDDIREFSFWYGHQREAYKNNIREETIKVRNILRKYVLEFQIKRVCTDDLGKMNYDELLIAGADYADISTVKEALKNGANIDYKDPVIHKTAVEHCEYMGHKGTSYWNNDYSNHKSVRDYLISQGASY